MNATGMPFDDIRKLARELPGPDQNAVEVTRNRNAGLPKPVGSLGQLEEINEWLAAWSGKSPQVLRPLVALFAGNHAVVEDGFTTHGMEATAGAVATISAGGGAINQFCVVHDLGLKIFDLALAHPVNDITKDAAFDERGCAATIAFGMEAIAGGTDLLCLSGMGVGQDISVSAIFSALGDHAPEQYLLTVEGDVEDAQKRKAKLVSGALELHAGHLGDPLEVLRRLGGREIAALFGAIMAARVQHIPVVLDGAAAMVAGLIAKSLSNDALDHCMLAHLGKSAAELAMANAINKEPMLQLGISLNDGSGGAAAMGLIKAAALAHAQMEAG